MELQKMETGDHVPGDSPGVRRVRTTGGGGAAVEEPQPGLQAEGVEHRFSLGAIVQGASARIRSVSRELRSFASSLSNPSSRYEPANSTALNGLIGLRFIRKTDGAAGWPDVEKCFHKLTASTNGLLARSHFAECIGMDKDSKEFGGKLFDALARKSEIKGDSIDKAQLKQFWDQISDESFDSRLQTFFDMVDRDDDGRITEDEVKEIITLSASANHLCNIQKQADEYAALIMEALDPKNLGYIQVDKLEKVLLEASKHSRRGDSRNLSQLLSEQLRRPAENSPLVRWCQDAKYFLQDNWRRVWIIVLWIGVMSGLFAYKYVQYRNKAAYQIMGYCVCMAKGAAETLKLNMALILLPVCRNTMTWLRNKTKLRVVVPFDDNLNFHMVVAVGVAVGTGIHVVYHMACDFPRLIHASSDRFVLLESFFKEQPSNYWQLIKGVEGVTGILLVVLMVIAFTLATPWLRRGKLTGFNAFWYSHHLFVIVYALLLYHGWKLYLSKKWYQKTTWMYLAVPVVLYALERLTRAFRSSIKPVKILKAVDYSGSKGVLALHMSKPDDFEYKSGQYMFVNCAAVSPFEWHPFSITSAPGEDYLSVHIQAVGDWTKQIKKVFSEALQASPSGKGGYLEGENHPNFPKVLIDGPYGAPAQEYKNYEVVMLVGLGIGTTPMISIVKDILHNIKEMEEEEDVDVEGGNGSITKRQGAGGEYENEFKTKRAYFYWMTRGQDSFDWFKGVMDEVAELDHNGVIELHNYCTSVHERGDARSAFITMIQDLNHEKKGYDIVSGTRVKSHFAKPSWRSVFKYIARENPETEVGVFYCGPPGPTKELRKLALDFSHNTSTTFDFHKENF